MRKTALKICGIRSLEEIEDLKELSIDYFGCIFTEKSPRYISYELAREIAIIVHQAHKKVVGVFLDASIESILQAIEDVQIDVIQLHGNETPEYCQQLFFSLKKYKEKKIKIWKAFPVKDTLPEIKDFLPYIEFPLFDAKGTQAGGNGIIFDWKILDSLPAKSFILAGGIDKENICKALSFSPSVLDVNSKVEINNRKNRKLIEEIILKIKSNEPTS